ncbi:small nuclear ribonucleoprotein Sm D3 [Tritrichomonas musculus]|uniref:Small nuclear ribonucleoprotein Sm D3 n=1 Tax=Tritrichomonas musculus TaxID=1915356 RepID=A0ABR2KR73_9EUKA
MSLGIPIKLLHEVIGFDIKVELISGDTFHGQLKLVEDNMNCWLNNVSHTYPNGHQVKSDTAYLRGSNILFFSVPDMFSNAKIFKTGEVTPKPVKKLSKLKRTFTTVTIRKQSR